MATDEVNELGRHYTRCCAVAADGGERYERRAGRPHRFTYSTAEVGLVERSRSTNSWGRSRIKRRIF
jgi:hypothetical protein